MDNMGGMFRMKCHWCAGVAAPAQPGRRYLKGRQAQRGGDGRMAFPWSASEARSAAGAKASAPGAAEK